MDKELDDIKKKIKEIERRQDLHGSYFGELMRRTEELTALHMNHAELLDDLNERLKDLEAN